MLTNQAVSFHIGQFDKDPGDVHNDAPELSDWNGPRCCGLDEVELMGFGGGWEPLLLLQVLCLFESIKGANSAVVEPQLI